MLREQKGEHEHMDNSRNDFDNKQDYDFIKWVSRFGENLTPKQRNAYIKMLAAYLYYLIVRYEDSELSEPSQSDGG